MPNHPQAQTQLHTGPFQFVRSSLGAWTLYGLGTENENLPGFVALNPPSGSAAHFGSGFLPAVYQAALLGSDRGRFQQRFRRNGSETVEIPNIKNGEISRDLQRRQLDYIQTLNRRRLERDRVQPEIEGAIEAFELAFRMQEALLEVMDFTSETPETLALYGINGGETDRFGRQCLHARRLVEAGVRFVELSHGNWDHHRNLTVDFPARCVEIDRPIVGLLEDLHRRDLLKDTLVIWAGEFGRTPHGQGVTDGITITRDSLLGWLGEGCGRDFAMARPIHMAMRPWKE